MTHYAIEKQFQDVSTIAKFKEFQRELSAKISCELSLYRENDVSLEFTMNKDIKVGETLHCDSQIIEFIIDPVTRSYLPVNSY